MFEHFPTEFAIKLAYSCDLLPFDERLGMFKLEQGKGRGEGSEEYKQVQKIYGAIWEFQNLAVANSFEDSLIAFHGITLNKEQKLALEIIHKNMPTFTKGLITGKLLSAFTDANDKLLVELAALLINILDETDPSEKDDKLLTAKKFIVKVSS